MRCSKKNMLIIRWCPKTPQSLPQHRNPYIFVVKKLWELGVALWRMRSPHLNSKVIFFCAASQTLHPHPMSIFSIASIARLVVNLFIDPTVNVDDYDNVVEEVVDKEVTRDYFLKLSFTNTPTKHSLRSRHNLREIPDKNTIRNNFEKLSVSKFNLFYPATPRTHPFFLIAH